MNSVNIIGNIGHELELKTTNSGKAVLNFNVAINDPFANDTIWARVTAWNATAENTAKYCSKGSKVAVSGRLSVNRYTNSQGQEVEQIEVIANTIDFLNTKQEFGAAQTQSQGPFQSTQNVNTSPFEKSNIGEISNDDLPF